MANEIDIDGLSISIEVNSEKASKGLDNVAKSAQNVKKAVSNINAGKALGNVKKEATDSTKSLTDLKNRMESLFSKGATAGKNFFNVDKLGITELQSKLQTLTNQYNKAMDTINTKMVSGITGGKTFDNQVISAGKLATRMDIVKDKIEALQTAQNSGQPKNFWEVEGWENKTGALNSVADGYTKVSESADMASLSVNKVNESMASTKDVGYATTAGEILEKQKQKASETAVEVKKLSNETMTMGEAWKNTFGFIGQSVKNLPKNLIGALSDKITSIKDKLTSLKSEGGLFGGIKGKFSEIISESDVSKVSKRASKITSALKNLGGFALKNLSGFTFLQRGFNKLADAGKHLSKSLSRVTKMFTLMLIRMALRKVIEGIKTGFTNLAMYSDSVSVSINGLRDSLSYLGNSFAAAFAPIINTVAPILSAFIDYLVGAINAINQLISSLLGFGTWTKATKLTQNYGKAVGGAGKAAKELNKQLQGFDELNNLTTNNGGGGGGGGGASTNYADMFTTEEVDAYWKSIADRIKDTWNFNDADFTWLGESLGKKVSEQLDGFIDAYPQLKETARKSGKAIGTLITGFVEVPDLGHKIGFSIASAIDIGVTGLNGFLENVHWDSVGKFIGDGINGISDSDLIPDVFTLLKNVLNGGINLLYGTGSAIDFKKLGSTIGKSFTNAIEGLDTGKLAQSLSIWITGALDGIASFLTNTDFEKVGKKIAEFFSNIDWKKIGISFLNLAGAIIEGIVDAVKGLWTDGDALTKIGLVIAGLIGLAKISGISVSLAGASITATGASSAGASLGTIISNACNAYFGTNPLTVAVSVIVAWNIGESIGKQFGAEIFAAITDDPQIYKYYQDFHWFGEGGFFSEVTDDLDVTKQALREMLDDIDNYWENTKLYQFFHKKKGKSLLDKSNLFGKGLSGAKNPRNDFNTSDLNNVDKAYSKAAKGIENASKAINSAFDSNSESMKSLSAVAGNMYNSIDTSTNNTHSNVVEKFSSMKNNSVALTEEQRSAVNAKYDDMRRATSSNTDSILAKVKSGFSDAKTEATNNTSAMNTNAVNNFTAMKTNSSTKLNELKNNVSTWSKDTKGIVSNTKANATFGVNTPALQTIADKMNNLKSKWTDKQATFSVATEQPHVLQQAYNGLKSLWNNHSATFSVNVAASASSLGSLVSEALGKIKTAFSNSGVSWLKNVVSKIHAYAKGGVADEATLGIFGEAGTEALVPLERNTKWLGRMSDMLLTEMQDRQFTLPQPSMNYNNSYGNGVYGSDNYAIAEQNALLQEQNNLLRQIASKNVSISSREVFNAVVNENRDYVNRTASSPFVF